MLVYVLICLCLSLVGVAALQMMYMAYVDRLDKERKKRVSELESQCRVLSERLQEADERIREQDQLLEEFCIEATQDEEVWADLIDER